MRIAVVANTAWYLVNFRLNLMRALQTQGHEVVAVAPHNAAQAVRLQAAGVVFAPVAISGAGTDPLRELQSVWALRRVFRQHGVQVVLSYTPKGNLYSALAALTCGLTGIPFVPNVSGLGRAFIRKSWVTVVVKLLYRLTLGRAHKVFFQNLDDMRAFVDSGWPRVSVASAYPARGWTCSALRPRPCRSMRPMRQCFCWWHGCCGTRALASLPRRLVWCGCSIRRRDSSC